MPEEAKSITVSSRLSTSSSSPSSIPHHIAIRTRLVVRSSLAVVSDKLESANHLTDGEEAEGLGGDNTGGGDLGGVEISGLVEEVLGGLEDGSALDGLQEVLVVGLEGSDGRRAHLLAAEDNLANLEADLGVVNNKGDLSLDETDDTTCSSTNLAQSVAQALGVAGNGRAGSAADARQTVLCLGRGVAGSLAGLLGGGALEAAGGKAHSRGSEHGTGEGLHFGLR